MRRSNPPLSDSARKIVTENHNAVAAWVSQNKLSDQSKATISAILADSNTGYISSNLSSNWAGKLHPYIMFIDLETTGLSRSDRIVSLSAIRLDTRSLFTNDLLITYMHLIFNPEKSNHAQAVMKHGYSDKTLRYQDKFSQHSADILKFIHRAPIIVSHNVNFDIGFLNRAFVSSGSPPVSRDTFCTMSEYNGASYSNSLDSICNTLGIGRSMKVHSALEDAWLCLQIYLRIHGCNLNFKTPPEMLGQPSNIFLPYGLL